MARIPGEPHTSPLQAVVQLFWFWIVAAVLLTIALAVVGGTRYLEPPAVQAALVAMVVLVAIRVRYRYRHRDEVRNDPRLRRDRERRGY
jgi:membrane protein YdbS with pleckstrin-like domain